VSRIRVLDHGKVIDEWTREKGWIREEAFLDGKHEGWRQGCLECFLWMTVGYLIGWGLVLLCQRSRRAGLHLIPKEE
jgi:hypothetical protein